jgi:O-antigen/teichoic acid export membrane protein
MTKPVAAGVLFRRFRTIRPDKVARALHADSALRHRLVNIGHLLSGNVIATLIALIGVVLTARSLGPADYGILALIISYARTFDRLMRFESWQPLIRYAANVDPHDPGRTGRLRELFAFGLRLDILACIGAALASAAIAYAFGPLLKLSADHLALVFLYCSSLAFNISGMPTAVLRLAGRFRTIAYVQVSGNVLRVLLCLFGLWRGGDLAYFVLAWTAAQIFGSLLFMAFAFVELRRQGIKGVLGARLRGLTTRFPGIMGFAWSSSLSTTIRSSSTEVDVLIVGALADPKSAGLYFMAKQLGKMAQQVCAQVQAVLYPDVARLWAERAYRAFHRAITQIQIVLGAFGLAALAATALFGELALRLAVGAAYRGVLPLLLVQLIAVSLTMHAAPLRSALLAMGEQRAVLHIVFWATLAFHATALLLVPQIGAMGANVAQVVLALLCAVGMERRRWRHGLSAGVSSCRLANHSSR